jgi:hypothetical protein
MRKSNILIIIIFVAIFFIFATVSSLDTVSATSINSIDKNSVMLNSEKSFSWEVKTYSNEKLVVKEIVSNGRWIDIKTTKIENFKKNKLKLTISNSGENITNYDPHPNPDLDTQVKYRKSKLTPKAYYLKIYKPKMIKNIQTKTTFDIGSASLKKDKNTTLKFNAISYKNGKVAVYKKYYGGIIGGNTVTTIEKYKTNKLKVTTTYLTGTPGNKKIDYVSSKYLPKEYYLKVLRKNISKEIISEVVFDKGEKYYNNNEGIEWITTISFDYSVHFSSGWFDNNTKWGKIVSVGGGYFLTIEKYANNKLKLTKGNPSIPPSFLSRIVTIVKTKYTPKEYYSNVIKQDKSFPNVLNMKM